MLSQKESGWLKWSTSVDMMANMGWPQQPFGVVTYPFFVEGPQNLVLRRTKTLSSPPGQKYTTVKALDVARCGMFCTLTGGAGLPKPKVLCIDMAEFETTYVILQFLYFHFWVCNVSHYEQASGHLRHLPAFLGLGIACGQRLDCGNHIKSLRRQICQTRLEGETSAE